jgi:hypothetical protein
MFKSKKNIYFHFVTLTSRRKNMGGNLGQGGSLGRQVEKLVYWTNHIKVEM